MEIETIVKPFTVIQDSHEVYHSHKEYIGSGGLKEIKRSPLHYLTDIITEKEPTDVQKFGSAYHSFILTPELFKDEYFIFNSEDRPEKDKTMASNMNKAWKAEIEVGHDKIISTKDMTILHEMKEVLFSDSYIKTLLSKGQPELSHYVENFEGARVKIRPDYMKDNVITDIKTCTDASTEDCTKNIASYDYHIQAALYVDVAEKCDGKKRRFIWIFQEKEPPYDTNIIKASEQMLAVGRFEYEILIRQWLKSQEENRYRGYSIFADNEYGITEVDLPAYKIKDLQFYDK
jgi:hypothetical protein